MIISAALWINFHIFSCIYILNKWDYYENHGYFVEIDTDILLF